MSQLPVTGYKVFNADFTCRNHQFGEHTEHQLPLEPIACQQGFHFCLKASDCFSYYKFDSTNIVCEVEALGAYVTHEDDSKIATNHIRIGRKLSWLEVLAIVNLGKDNTGLSNSGDLNSGDWNSGNLNSGNLNSGDWNSGDLNSGNRNSGNRNSGNRNSGDLNSGDRNSGDWNSGDDLTGVLCSQNVQILMFDKPSGMTLSQWRDTEAYYLMRDIVLTEWVSWSTMSDAEKEQYPRAQTADGYLKRYEYKQAHATWWAKLAARHRTLFTSLPNFDASAFKAITGIEVGPPIDAIS